MALLTSFSDQQSRQALLNLTPDLGTANFVETTAEDLSDGVLQSFGPGANPSASQNRRAEEQKKQDAQKAELVKNKELVERLDLEIGFRLSQSQVHLASLVRDWDGKKKHFTFREGRGEMDVRNILDGLSQPADKKSPALYQEFSNLSTIALIAELRRHVSLKEKEELDKVLADLSGIYIFLDVHKVPISDVRAVGGRCLTGSPSPDGGWPDSISPIIRSASQRVGQ